ncbi:MAG: hypothetical protein C5B59_17415 [Bacteroidetes bacterium]|nr:MAG: hypothetical protein C5B59_17415 [Bacteroidota bacterium]
MQTSDSGLKFLMDQEGFNLIAYYDNEGYATQGVGHLLTHVKYVPLTQFPQITIAQALEWLRDDVRHCEMCISVNITPWRTMAQNEYDAVVSLIFNIGTEAFATSTVCRVLRPPEDADRIMPAWEAWNCETDVNGHMYHSPALLARRKRELALYYKSMR